MSRPAAYSQSGYPPAAAGSANGQYSDGLRIALLHSGRGVREHLMIPQFEADLRRFQVQHYDGTPSAFACEMSKPYFDDQPGANIRGAVAYVGCKTGQTPNRSLPLSALIQLSALELFSRTHPEVAPFALVGLESANRGLVKSHGETHQRLCRYAFKVARLIESWPTLFARVTPVLDCEVLWSDGAVAYSRQRKELDVGDSDRIATAVRALSLSAGGIQLKVGASNFSSRRNAENAKRFANRDQMHLFIGQTLSEDEQLRGSTAFLYTAGPVSRRLGQLAVSVEEVQDAGWLLVDHLRLSEAEFKLAWQEHEQIADLYRVIAELDPALSIVNESLAWALDCSQRMLDFHDQQLFEISTNSGAVSARTIENLKRDYSRAMRTYLRDLAARNFDWLLSVSKQVGFQVESAGAPGQSRADSTPAGFSGPLPTAKNEAA